MAAQASAGESLQVVTLGIDRETFAVPVEAVSEILDMRPTFRIPDGPPYLLGLTDVRGRGVPVIDLRSKLGLPATQATDNTRILVLEVQIAGRNLVLGLTADRVFEVATLGGQDVEPPPDIGSQWRSRYIRGVGRHSDRFVFIFDLSRLFTSEEAAYLGAAASASAPEQVEA